MKKAANDSDDVDNDSVQTRLMIFWCVFFSCFSRKPDPINLNPMGSLPGSFLNPSKYMYYSVQYPNGTFFVLQQNRDIKPRVKKW